ncbi:MAG: methionine--tRNA ligase [Proteobacteria bacterium]|nr:methionine--tRNA ligase [Pseudomonadota bacterium]
MSTQKAKGNFYVTTPIYYVNDAPHIGHAYTSIACDCLARFKRLDGFNVKFLTGTDEHGQKVEKSALNKGKAPKEFCDEVSVKFKDLAQFLGISNDDFIRTTDDRHKKVAQLFWQNLSENGWIYKDVYEGWYALRDEAFYNEDELVDGKAPTGAEVEWHKEESYFFRLSEFGDVLVELIEKDLFKVEPQSKKNEVLSFVKGGLKDLSISRTSFKWGVPVPNDDKHIMYVWLDALTNYLSAISYPDGDEYKQFWQEGEVTHIVGKDILRFHAVYWPAFLLASQNKRPEQGAALTQQEKILPSKIFAHGWWTNEGQKISKSVGNIIDPYKEIEWLQSFEISQETAIDYLRYFLMKEVPFGNDGDYSRAHFIERINAELANNIGNLTQRTLNLIVKNCDGVIPESNFEETNKDLIALSSDEITSKAAEVYKDEVSDQQFHKALQNTILIASRFNKYLEDKAPWNLKKEGKIEEMNLVLANTAEAIRKIAILLLPFIPTSANKILDLLNIEQNDRNFAALDKALQKGHKVNKPEPIFKRIQNNNPK